MTEKTVVIHMGLAKTGSTSIQKFLASNVQALEREGTWFPLPNVAARSASREPGVGSGPHTELVGKLARNRAKCSPEGWAEWVAIFEAFDRSDRLDTLVLSHEMLGNWAPRLDFEILKDRIAGHRVRILFFIRHAETWLASLYEQDVRGKGRSTVLPDQDRFAVKFPTSSFQDIARAVMTAFPEAEITVASFDAIARDGALLPYFAAFAGLSPEMQAAARTARHFNQGAVSDQVAVLFHSNRLGVARAHFNAFRRAFGWLNRRGQREKPARVSIFSLELAGAIDRRYRDDLRFLRETLGVDIAAAGPLPRAEGLEPMRLAPETVRRIRDETLPLLDPAAASEFSRVLDAMLTWRADDVSPPGAARGWLRRAREVLAPAARSGSG